MTNRIEPHQRENNDASEEYLQENQKRFSKQCLLVLHLLYSGIRLTCKSALVNYSIGHLPRRLADLKENGVHIDERWLTDSEGRRTVKEWFINFKTDRTKKNVTEKWQKVLDKKPEYIQPDLL